MKTQKITKYLMIGDEWNVNGYGFDIWDGNGFESLRKWIFVIMDFELWRNGKKLW